MKSICVSHLKDVDGCVCAVLFKLAIKSGFLLTNYGNIINYLSNIDNDYDYVYVCDLGMNNSILEQFRRIRQFAELTYIDHHPLSNDLLKKLEQINVKIVHDLRDCASVLCYNLLNEFLPREAGLLASYAAISDRLEDGPIAKRIIQKHDREFILFETMLLSYALETADVKFKKRIVRQLSKLIPPHKIKDVTKSALKQADRITELRNELPSIASTFGKTAYVQAKKDSLGMIANLLLDVCEANIGIAYKPAPKKDYSDISIRGSNDLKTDLGKMVSQLAETFGGFGGGHPKASGARIPTSSVTDFIRAFHNLK